MGQTNNISLKNIIFPDSYAMQRASILNEKEEFKTVASHLTGTRGNWYLIIH